MQIRVSELRKLIREVLLRESAQPVLQGILLLKPENQSDLLDLQSQVLEKFPDMKPVPSDKLHITMLHQSKTKPLKGQTLPAYEGPIGFGNVYLVDRGVKKSIFVAADAPTQVALNDYMNQLAKSFSVATDETRTFHVSLANMTGSPGDSVGHSDAEPITSGAEQIQL